MLLQQNDCIRCKQIGKRIVNNDKLTEDGKRLSFPYKLKLRRNRYARYK